MAFEMIVLREGQRLEVSDYCAPRLMVAVSPEGNVVRGRMVDIERSQVLIGHGANCPGAPHCPHIEPPEED